MTKPNGNGNGNGKKPGNGNGKDKNKNKDKTNGPSKSKAAAIGKGLSAIGDSLKGIATANAPYQSTNYTPISERRQRPIDISPFDEQDTNDARG